MTESRRCDGDWKGETVHTGSHVMYCHGLMRDISLNKRPKGYDYDESVCRMVKTPVE